MIAEKFGKDLTFITNYGTEQPRIIYYYDHINYINAMFICVKRCFYMRSDGNNDNFYLI